LAATEFGTPGSPPSGGMKKLALASRRLTSPRSYSWTSPRPGTGQPPEFWDILAELHLQGVTILVSTPMDYAERVRV
jgi:hypothetical protein